jgi:uncharacterized protein YciI
MSNVTHYLYTLHPVRPEMLAHGPTPEEADIVAQHFAYLKQLTEQGVVVLAGRTLLFEHPHATDAAGKE